MKSGREIPQDLSVKEKNNNVVYQSEFLVFIPDNLYCLLGYTGKVSQIEEFVSPHRQLSVVYDLETGICVCVACSYCNMLRGGYLLDIQFDAKRKKTLCRCLAVLGLLPLLVFKYYNFLNDSLTGVLEAVGLHFALPGLNWAMPVGISFFTFQAVGYLLDVYHKRVPAEKDFIDFALFVSFFPQVVSGPISTANELMPQIKKQHQFDYSQVVQGLKLLLYGLFMKLVIADRFGQFVDLVYGHYGYYSGVTCLKAAVAYSIQIYFDFCGYSFLAIGLE